MTPQPSPRRDRAPHHIVRRSATFLVAAAVMGSAPLVAQALGDGADEVPRSARAAEAADVTDPGGPEDRATIHDRRPVSLLAAAGLDPVDESDVVDDSQGPVLRAAIENVRPDVAGGDAPTAAASSGSAAASTPEGAAGDGASAQSPAADAASEKDPSAESKSGESAQAEPGSAAAEKGGADGGTAGDGSEPAAAAGSRPKDEGNSEKAPEPDPVQIATEVLSAAYEWDETGPRIVTLQEVLGVTADGWYGYETARAHRAALEFASLPTDALPVVPVPPGPSPDQWAALRQCEAGGNYSITSSSGTYRGAYQFNQSTWNSVAARHAPGLVGVDPAAASPADQDALALALYHERGSSPWPHCGRHLR